VTREVDVGVVTGIGRVFDMSCGDGDTTLSLFGRFINGAIVEEGSVSLFGLSFCDSCCEGSLVTLLDLRLRMYAEVIELR
jgi:hypothetical protein